MNANVFVVSLVLAGLCLASVPTAAAGACATVGYEGFGLGCTGVERCTPGVEVKPWALGNEGTCVGRSDVRTCGTAGVVVPPEDCVDAVAIAHAVLACVLDLPECLP